MVVGVKKIFTFALAALLAHAAGASVAASFPSELHLKSGMVLREVSLLRFEGDSVVVRYANGSGSVLFSELTDTDRSEVMWAKSMQEGAAGAGMAAKAAEPPAWPGEITLKNGFVMKKVTEITKVANDSFTVRYVAGLAPVRFDGMAPDSLVEWAPLIDRAAAFFAEREKKLAEAKENLAVAQGELQRAQAREAAEREARAKTCEDAVQHNLLMVGMTADQVRRSWGSPYKINRTAVSGVVTEQWCYSRGGSAYAYLDNGVLTGWQDATGH